MVHRLYSLLQARLNGGSFFRSVLVLAGGAALGQGLAVLASPLLTRLYAPSDLGTLAAYTSILSIPVVIASLCYDLAIPLPVEDKTAAALLVLSLGIALGMTILVALLVWLLGDSIIARINTPALGPYLWLVPVGFLGMAIYRALNQWAVRKQAFERIAQTKLTQSLSMVVTQLGFGLLHLAPLGLLVGDLLGRIAGSGSLGSLAWRQIKTEVGSLSRADLGQALARYRRFPLLSSGSILLNSAGLQLPPLLLAGLYGPEIAGWFSLSQRVIGVPSTLVGQAVAQVYLGTAARLARKDIRALHTLFLRTAQRLALIGVAPLALLALCGPWLFAFLFGEPWREAGVYVRLLSTMLLLQLVAAPLSYTLSILERQDLQLAWDAGRLLAVVGGFALARGLEWPAQTAVLLYGGLMFIAYAVLLVLSNYAIGSRLRSHGG